MRTSGLRAVFICGLIGFGLLAATQRSSRARVMPAEMLPSVPMREALTAAEERFERCAIRSRFSEAALRQAALQVKVRSGRVRELERRDWPDAHAGRARTLERCAAREIRRALRAREIRRDTRPYDFRFKPFEHISLPMQAPRLDMYRTLDAAGVTSLVSALGGAASLEARLDMLRRLEADRTGVSVSDAGVILSRFERGQLTAAGLLCRVLVGRRAISTVYRALDRSGRRRLRLRTRGRCGTSVVEAPSTTTTRPSITVRNQCSSDRDCVLACPAAPTCCGAPCGCQNAIPRDQAEQNAAFCRANPPAPGACPAMGCAHREFRAVCQEGRCRAVAGAL